MADKQATERFQLSTANTVLLAISALCLPIALGGHPFLSRPAIVLHLLFFWAYFQKESAVATCTKNFSDAQMGIFSLLTGIALCSPKSIRQFRPTSISIWAKLGYLVLHMMSSRMVKHFAMRSSQIFQQNDLFGHITIEYA